MVTMRPLSRITTPLPMRSVPSIGAVKPSSGMCEDRRTTAFSARSRSKSTSAATGCICEGKDQCVTSLIAIRPRVAASRSDNPILRLRARPPARSRSAAHYRSCPLPNRQYRLAARPDGLPKRTDWNFGEEPLRDPAEGEVLVKVLFISLDPAMRGWMNEGKSYIPPVGSATSCGRAAWDGSSHRAIRISWPAISCSACSACRSTRSATARACTTSIRRSHPCRPTWACSACRA